ncbi:MAG: hypothetical protein ACYC2K_04965 [Gemmatimonadales bacterium]
MNDDRDELDPRVRELARGFREPPATPREEIWARIQASRQSPTGNRRPGASVLDLEVARRRRSRWLGLVGTLAAALVIGVGIGRWSSADLTGPITADRALADAARRGENVMRYAAVEHLGQVEALLIDLDSGNDREVALTAHSLLTKTQLLLDSKRLTDPDIRALLTDLEMLLVQVAQLDANGSAIDRELIDENLSDRAIRPRLRNAVPAGPGGLTL